MIGNIFNFLEALDGIFWSYIAFSLIIFFGIVFSIKTRLTHIIDFPKFFRIFFNPSQFSSRESEKGIHPIRLFFASSGGMIGIGNIVGIVTAVCLGGPGAVFWVWVAGALGSIVKYSEVFLGIKFRRVANDGSYQGGPMYFLAKAYRNSWIPKIVAVLLCIYGIEIYQFSVIANSISTNWNIPKYGVISALLLLVVYTVRGGLKRLGKICSILLPFFMLTYCAMGLIILFIEWRSVPQLLISVFSSAFKGHAAIGGFVGCSVITAIHQGVSRASYSGDIGIGFDSVIHSESSADRPEVQARLSIVGVAIDNIICTMSLIIVLAAGTWKSMDGSNIDAVIQAALAQYFPGIRVFFPLLLFFTGYTTITAYFLVGRKCAEFLLSGFGKKLYFYYGLLSFPLFCFLPQTQTLTIMSISGAMLMVFNLIGIFLLRREVSLPRLSTEVFSLKEVNRI